MDEVTELRRRAGLTQAALAAGAGVPQPNIAAYETGKRRPSAATMDRIRSAAKPRPSIVLAERRSEVLDLVRRHRAANPRVFGSVSRGEDTSGSDVDLLVTFDAGASLFDLVELREDLQDLLGVKVDIVSEGGLRSSRIAHEARPL
ncbi:nucleotidyltransferase domain-containing protein [Georgenia yuyongxinii]